jgi:DNA repair photolyase
MVGIPQVAETTLSIIERLNRKSISVAILTKGVLPLELANRDRFPCPNTYGISLVSLDEAFRYQWEPGAASYKTRIAALRQLHDAGCRTRVHMEPYPPPNIIEQDLSMLLESVGFVDSLFFGGWNYNPRVANYPSVQTFYKHQTEVVIQFCRRVGIECEM